MSGHRETFEGAGLDSIPTRRVTSKAGRSSSSSSSVADAAQQLSLIEGGTAGPLIRASEILNRVSAATSSMQPLAAGASSGTMANISIMQPYMQEQQQLQHANMTSTSSGCMARPTNNMMSMNINTSTPCAACKLLRRRCAQECPFAPYFSPHEPQRFASVHKIYGASNVSKMLMEVREDQRADAANSLVYEANARIRDPVYGCMGLVSQLQQQAQVLQAELNAVRGEVMRYRACHVEVAMQQHHHQQQQQSSYAASSNPTGSSSMATNIDHHPSQVRSPLITLSAADTYLNISHSSPNEPPDPCKDVRLLHWP